MKNYFLPLLALSLVIMALICAPHSCEWGNMVYSYFGIAGLAAVFIFPFFNKDFSAGQKLKYAFGYAFLFLVLWVLLFMVWGFRIMCRLF